MRIMLTFTLAAAAALGCASCGILSAPVSVPAAVASNANFSLHGQTVDINGAPLDGVLLSQELDHHFWTPIAGGTDTHEPHLRRVDRAFKVDERGALLNLVFTREGYYDAAYSFTASDYKYVTTPAGDWPNAENFPVVMISRGTPDVMPSQTWSGNIDYTSYPRQQVIDLANVAPYTRSFTERNADESNTLTSGLLFLSLVKETPRAINSRGDVDPAEVNLPGSITLRISGQDSGFIRIAPRLGYSPMQVSDTAPQSGYSQTFIIGRERLREMRSSPLSRIMEAHEYFYFRFGNRCGKGFISWESQLVPEARQVQPLVFHYAFWIQRNANDPNLTTHQAKSI